MMNSTLYDASGSPLGPPAMGIVDYGQQQSWGYWDGFRPYPLTLTNWTITTTNGHHACGCPNCAGDCCACADCKVKRLEQRVAELEEERIVTPRQRSATKSPPLEFPPDYYDTERGE